MKNAWKVIIVLILVSAVTAVVLLKKAENKNQSIPVEVKPAEIIEVKEVNQSTEKMAEPNNAPLVMTVEIVEPVKKLPRLVDLGADKCIPCKMMKPVLEELDKEYKGKLQVEFYDVWKDPAPGQQYGIRVIPTQIFLSPDGKELFRHEGFFSKEDILAKWKMLGFDLSK
ncbi:MAG: thioredoxin family protein [Sedimentisphaerales bacterium]